jgi:hypothetical protein
MLKSFIRIFFSLIVFSLFSGCVPASDDEFDDISVGKIPLKTGNKWIYDITRGSESFTDSAVILDYLPYQIDGLTNRFLYLYKDISFTYEMSQSFYDTVYIKLIEYDGDLLFQYGNEKRDRSGFLYGQSVIFNTPEIMLDHSEHESVEELFISSLKINRNGYTRTVNDTIINCMKKRVILSTGSFITSDLNYDLYYYFTDIGVLKIEGTVNSSAFSAKAFRCTLK